MPLPTPEQTQNLERVVCDLRNVLANYEQIQREQAEEAALAKAKLQQEQAARAKQAAEVVGPGGPGGSSPSPSSKQPATEGGGCGRGPESPVKPEDVATDELAAPVAEVGICNSAGSADFLSGSDGDADRKPSGSSRWASP